MGSIDGRTTATIVEACKIAAVSRRTIYNWLRDKKIDYTRTAGGSIRIFADTLHADNPRKKS